MNGTTDTVGRRDDPADVHVSRPTVGQLLRALPKERLVDVLAEELAPQELGRRIAEVRGARRPPRQVRAALLGLTADRLTDLAVATGAIDETRAWREYREYRFTARPSLYLRAVRGRSTRPASSPSRSSGTLPRPLAGPTRR